jgi:hypothetical protein
VSGPAPRIAIGLALAVGAAPSGAEAPRPRQSAAPNATRSVEESVATALWIAPFPDDSPTGDPFQDKKPIPW